VAASGGKGVRQTGVSAPPDPIVAQEWNRNNSSMEKKNIRHHCPATRHPPNALVNHELRRQSQTRFSRHSVSGRDKSN
jgi:hypothetical protein